MSVTLGTDSSVSLTLEIDFSADPKDSGAFGGSETDVSAYMRLGGLRIIRGRTHVRDTVEAGTLSVALDNIDRRFDPTNTSGAYYPNVLPTKPIRLRAVHNSITYDLFRGTIDEWTHLYAPGMTDAIVVLECTDDFKLIAMDRIASTESQEASGTRIGNILDDTSWPAGRRDLDTGDMSVVAATVECVSPLDEIQSVVDTEVGLFFMAGDGDATFQEQTYRAGVSSSGTFSDDGSDLGYEYVETKYGDSQVWNSIITTRAGNDAQVTSEDASSVAAYGRRRLRLNDLLVVDATDQATIADLYRDTWKDPQYRVEALEFHPQKDPSSLWPVALGTELSDKYNVEITPPGGGSPSQIDQDVFVEQIEHEITFEGLWRTKFTTSNA